MNNNKKFKYFVQIKSIIKTLQKLPNQKVQNHTLLDHWHQEVED
jgi:hypothetical protein